MYNYQLSNHIIAQVSKLDEEKKKQFDAMYFSSEKKTSTAWLLFIFLGAVYGYTDNWGKQILYWLTCGGFGLWTLILLFQVSSIVREYNDKQALIYISTL